MYKRSFWFCSGALIALAFIFPLEADARSHRVDDIPNGSRFGCLNCHRDNAGSAFAPMGISVTTALMGDGGAAEQQADWSLLYDRDSDADGFTNGEELNDSRGEWRIGDPDPGGTVFNPSDPDDHPPAFCGDGRITPPEECEGDDLFNRTCEVLGYESGELSCTASCRFDTSLCVGETTAEEEDMSMMESTDVADPSSDSGGGSSGGCHQGSGSGPVPWMAFLMLLGWFGFSRRRRPESPLG